MSKVYSMSETLMGMNDETWLRHANPWSVWTRVVFPMPLLMLAIWSRLWLGWYALVPLGLTILFIWLNPRMFGVPANFESWAARGVLGERVFLRQGQNVDPQHRPLITWLPVISGLSVVPLVYGLWVYDLGFATLGAVTIVISKMWLVDRMAWIFDDFRRSGGTIKQLETGN